MVGRYSQLVDLILEDGHWYFGYTGFTCRRVIDGRLMMHEGGLRLCFEGSSRKESLDGLTDNLRCALDRGFDVGEAVFDMKTILHI